MAFIEHRFGKTYYTKKGRRGKTPIIWLHGGPGGIHRPDSEIFRLAEDRHVYCYTQIGSGRSSKTDTRFWNIETFVEELHLLIKAWGLTEFHLMGGSWGTTLALEYYLRKDCLRKGRGKSKRKIKSLVFQSPLFSSKDWKADGVKLISAMPQKTQKVINACQEIGATDSAVYEKAMFEYYLRHVLRNKTRLKEMFARANPNGALIYQYMWGPSEFEPTGTLKRYSRLKDLGKIDIPVMILCGEFDEARPETGMKYANRISACQFAEVKGASHAIWVEKPAKMEKLIGDFLAQIDD